MNDQEKRQIKVQMAELAEEFGVAYNLHSDRKDHISYVLPNPLYESTKTDVPEMQTVIKSPEVQSHFLLFLN